jgi:hypothetical protein
MNLSKGMKLCAVSCALVLGGCGTVVKPAASDMDAVRQGRTAILFVDEPQQINYLEDHYLLLAVTTTTTASVYRGIWDSNTELSSVFASEYEQAGLHSHSVYDVLPSGDVARLLGSLTSKQRPGGEADAAGIKDDALPAIARDALVAQNQDYLIWLTWSGLTFHIKTLGLSPRELVHVNYKLVDLRANRVLGVGGCGGADPVELKGRTAKDFLESENLAGLKSELRRMFHEHMKTCSPWNS